MSWCFTCGTTWPSGVAEPASQLEPGAQVQGALSLCQHRARRLMTVTADGWGAWQKLPMHSRQRYRERAACHGRGDRRSTGNNCIPACACMHGARQSADTPGAHTPGSSQGTIFMHTRLVRGTSQQHQQHGCELFTCNPAQKEPPGQLTPLAALVPTGQYLPAGASHGATSSCPVVPA